MSESSAFLLILLGISLLAGSASAGAFVIDTADITASVGSTVQIPVRVTDADRMSGFQLLINTGNIADAVIQINASSASALTYSDETGILIWAGALRGETITGEKNLFLLDVTPKTGQPVPLSVEVTETFSGLTPAVQVENYAGYSAVLQTGKNTGGGESIQPVPEITPEQTQTPSETGGYQPGTSTPAVVDDAGEKEGLSLPYWVIIVLAVAAFLGVSVVLKKP